MGVPPPKLRILKRFTPLTKLINEGLVITLCVYEQYCSYVILFGQKIKIKITKLV